MVWRIVAGTRYDYRDPRMTEMARKVVAISRKVVLGQFLKIWNCESSHEELIPPSMVYNGHAITDTNSSPSYGLYKRGCMNHIREF